MLRRIRAIDRLTSGRMSRREFQKALGLFGLSLVAYPVVTRPVRAADNLLVFGWAGFDDPALFPGYEENHGSPDHAFFSDEQEGIQKLKAGFGADIVRPCIDVMQQWMTADLKPIDESKLLYLDEQFESIRAPAPAYHDGQRFFVSLYWGFTSFIYRTDMTDITPEEESWSLLFDDRFAGRIAVWDSTDCVIPHTSLALGHSDDPFRPDGERLDQVADMIRKQRNLVRLYYPDVTTGVQAIASGEVVISYAWSEFLQPLRDEGIPFRWAKPKEGLISYNCGLALRDGNASEEAQYDFVNASMSADAGKFLIEVFNLGAANQKSFDMVDPSLIKEIELTSPDESLAGSHPFVYVPLDLKSKHIELFESIKAGA